MPWVASYAAHGRLPPVLPLFLAFVATAALALPQAPAPRAVVEPSPRIDLGLVVRGAVSTREFVLRNTGTAPLLVQGVELTPGLRMERAAAHVPPGETAMVRLSVDTQAIDGPFELRAVLRVNDPVTPVVELTLAGAVVPPIQVLPRPGVALVGQRGSRTQASLEIVNHLPRTVRLLAPQHESAWFSSELVALEEGKRYRLTLTLSPDALLGKRIVPVLIPTDATEVPAVRVTVAVYVRNRVYTFPDAVDLGAVPLAQWRTSPASLAQTLMVYQVGGTSFGASFTTDVPGLRITAEPGKARDRWQATLTLDPDRVTVGPLRGSITIETDDPEFPRLVVPVAGEILPDTPAPATP